MAPVAGVVAVASLPVLAVSFPYVAGADWNDAAWVVAGLAVIVLATTIPSLAASIRVRPTAAGLPDDLAPVLPRSVTPTRFALALAGVIVVVLGLAGVVTNDPYDGFLRGFSAAAACLVGYAALGRYLGPRMAPRLRPASGT